uniref:Formin-like protein n=1 Tax=Anthurium amnicola TaxID=1678845 RepID=A0A1D1YKD1_9ARAE
MIMGSWASSTPLLLLLFFCSYSSLVLSLRFSVCSSSAFAAGRRRILHQPLFPADWTPPPPESRQTPFSSDPPPFFPGTPSQPGTSVPVAPTNVSSASSRHAGPRSGAAKKIAIWVSVSVAGLALVSLSACVLYRRRVRAPDGSEKLVGGAGNDGSRRFPLLPGHAGAAAAPDLLYLGTVEPSGGRGPAVVEYNGSPHRKLTPVRALEMAHQPSPELQPMPPLAGQPRRVDPLVVLSDDDVFYTPQMSAASLSSTGSPCSSTVSRKSLPTVGSGKEIAVCTVDSTPRPRRTSPKSRLSSSTPCEVALLPPTRAPPPPPPLPPLPSQTRAPTPSPGAEPVAGRRPPLPPPPPPPLQPAEVGVEQLPPSGATSLSVPVQPASRGHWVIPTSPGDAPVPVAEVRSNDSSSFPARQIVGEEDNMDSGGKPRLKPLHWDKVRASSDRDMVWDQLKSSSFQLNEDMFETLFSTSTNLASKEGSRRPVLPSAKQDNRVLDPKKSQNIAILLRALNVTREEVSEALLDGNSEVLGVELLETLIKMAPTKEEELRLRDFTGDVSKLGSAERFLKAVLDIPFSFKRIDAMLYRANFDSEVKYLRKSFECLEVACGELKHSRLFLKLLDAVLKAGNRMNVGTVRGQAKAFKLDTLLKLADVKGTDGKTTLLHFVVQEIIRSEGATSESLSESKSPILNKLNGDEFKKQGLKMMAGLSKELGNVRKAAGMDSDLLNSYVLKLELGLEKIKMVLQLGRTSSQGKFFEEMKVFLKEAEEEIAQVKTEEKATLTLVKDITDYFHGDAAKEEAHPFRIFMVLRDFLSVLDHVCKEVEKTQEHTIVGSARSLRISASTSLPVLNRFSASKDESSGEDSSSS